MIVPLQKDDWTALERLYTRLSPRVRHAILRALSQGVDPATLAAAVTRLDVEEIVRLVALPDDARQEVAAQLARGVHSGMMAAATEFAAADLFASNPEVARYAEMQAARLIRYLTETQRQAVYDVLNRGFRVALTPQQMAEEIARTVGLLPAHAVAVVNFRAGLEERELSGKRIAALTDSYARRLRQYRANNIARTETMTALSAGQQAATETLVREGVIDPREYVKGWVVTRSDKTCLRCRSMNGQKVEIGERFVELGTGTRVMYPPLHPACRCEAQVTRRAESTRVTGLPAYVPDRRSLRPEV